MDYKKYFLLISLISGAMNTMAMAEQDPSSGYKKTKVDEYYPIIKMKEQFFNNFSIDQKRCFLGQNSYFKVSFYTYSKDPSDLVKNDIKKDFYFVANRFASDCKAFNFHLDEKANFDDLMAALKNVNQRKKYIYDTLCKTSVISVIKYLKKDGEHEPSAWEFMKELDYSKQELEEELEIHGIKNIWKEKNIFDGDLSFLIEMDQAINEKKNKSLKAMKELEKN